MKEVYLSQIKNWWLKDVYQLIDWMLDNKKLTIINDYSSTKMEYHISDIDTDLIDFLQHFKHHELCTNN